MTIEFLDLTIEIIILVLLFYVLLKLKEKKTIKITRDEFILSLNALETTIENYKNTFLEEKILLLKAEHDLDPKSKTNSIVLFNDKLNNVFKEASKDIFRLISDHTLKILLNFYSNDGLILHIISLLKR